MIALGNDVEGGHGVWGRNGRHHASSRGAGQGDLINRLDVERALAGIVEGDKQGRAAISGGDDDPRIPRGALADFIADQIKRRLAEHGMEAWVYGRGKRPFSIWRKLQTKKLSFEQLSDIFGFRVIVGSTNDCYRALGIIHTSWQMVPERFKDFISTPKPNGYRSIHTTVIGPEKQRVEIQIRTQEMHDIAERGVAAHWRYREHVPEAGSNDDSVTYGWLRDMVDLLEREGALEELPAVQAAAEEEVAFQEGTGLAEQLESFFVCHGRASNSTRGGVTIWNCRSAGL